MIIENRFLGIEKGKRSVMVMEEISGVHFSLNSQKLQHHHMRFPQASLFHLFPKCYFLVAGRLPVLSFTLSGQPLTSKHSSSTLEPSKGLGSELQWLVHERVRE